MNTGKQSSRGPQIVVKPPTKPKLSCEGEPEPGEAERAQVTAIAGVKVMRPVPRKDGSLAWQKLKGNPSQGAELVSFTRWAIAVCDGHPFEVVETVIGGLPDSVLANCKHSRTDFLEISQEIARLIPDEGLRNTMVSRRLQCLDRNPDVEEIGDDRWRGTHIDLEKLSADMESVDRENVDLLQEREWRNVPEKVLRAISRRLGYPRPDNLTRYEVNWDD
jgi:hypothetical protein